MGFEPTTLRDLVGCSNHLSYWRLYGEQGPICGSQFVGIMLLLFHLQYTHFGGWLAASWICFKVTARCC